MYFPPSNFFTYTPHHPSVQIMNEESLKLRTRGAASSNIPGFLGALAKLLKATITFVVCLFVCPSVRPHGKLGSHWKDIHEI
jgi:hypothetical protein